MIPDIQIIFSDIDGTLVHYPKNFNAIDFGPNGTKIIKLPPSSTGMQGIISCDTLLKCQELRRQGKKFVLVSGMRSTTMWKRIPYLPRADAYCCEAGGRIFYPVPANKGSIVFKLQPFQGADESDLEPFSLEEDLAWRSKMEIAAGVDGFVGNELESVSVASKSQPPVDHRKGSLWEHCVELQRKGFVVDTQGYSVCFRINRSQQDSVSQSDFEALRSIEPPEGLSSSINLGCIDFYPYDSGKKHCCQYIAKRLCKAETELNANALCLCDDDNDLELALACRQSFVPGISSPGMARVIEVNPGKFIVTGGIDGLEEGTIATERALERVLDVLK